VIARTVSVILTLTGFAVLSLGGWLGGTVAYVHGMPVLSLVSEPAQRAVAPVPYAEKEAGEGAGGESAEGDQPAARHVGPAQRG
jgi:hypothetical protein